MADTRRQSRSKSCATARSRTRSPYCQTLQGAVHRRHVGAAGAAVHQGRPRRHAQLPLVVPHGDLRQLRHDDRRQAQAVVPDLPARLLSRARCASRRSTHFPIERDLVVDAERLRQEAREHQALHHSEGAAHARAGRVPADAASSCEQYEQFSSLHQLHAVLRRLPAVRAQSEVHRPGRAGAAAPLQRRFARRRPGRAQRNCVNAEEGVWGCTAVGYCSEVCPKGVDPANAINQNKVNSAMDYFGVLKFLMPKGGRLMSAGQDLRSPHAGLVAQEPVLRALHDPRREQRVSSRSTRSSCWWACSGSRKARPPTRRGAQR